MKLKHYTQMETYDIDELCYMLKRRNLIDKFNRNLTDLRGYTCTIDDLKQEEVFYSKPSIFTILFIWNEIVCMARLCFMDKPTISTVYTVKEYRRRGFMTMLLNHIITLYGKPIEVEPINYISQNLYHNVGFHTLTDTSIMSL